MRPRQWIKNVFIFAGLIFSRNLFDTHLLIKVIAGFSLFCLGASSIYIFNDIKDINKDKEHSVCFVTIGKVIMSILNTFIVGYFANLSGIRQKRKEFIRWALINGFGGTENAAGAIYHVGSTAGQTFGLLDKEKFPAKLFFSYFEV